MKSYNVVNIHFPPYQPSPSLTPSRHKNNNFPQSHEVCFSLHILHICRIYASFYGNFFFETWKFFSFLFMCFTIISHCLLRTLDISFHHVVIIRFHFEHEAKKNHVFFSFTGSEKLLFFALMFACLASYFLLDMSINFSFFQCLCARDW